MDVPAPAVLQPAVDLSLIPPADIPEAAFDMIAAANLQPAATLELDPAPEPDTEEPAAAADPENALNSEPEANVDHDLPEEEVEDEEISLEEVKLYLCQMILLLCQFSVALEQTLLSVHTSPREEHDAMFLWCFRRQKHQETRIPVLLRPQPQLRSPLSRLRLQPLQEESVSASVKVTVYMRSVTDTVGFVLNLCLRCLDAFVFSCKMWTGSSHRLC